MDLDAVGIHGQAPCVLQPLRCSLPCPCALCGSHLPRVSEFARAEQPLPLLPSPPRSSHPGLRWPPASSQPS